MSRPLKVLVTAGPTREHIDPVRYLSNESSGRMGFEIARAAAAAGHRVTLIAGPVHLETPAGVERVDVVSALEMLAALEAHFPSSDALYMAAAVGDFRPKERFEGKWKKKEEGGGAPVLELVENPDLLRTVARGKGDRKVIAFALETSDGPQRAAAKLVRKNADWIVLNGASALNAPDSSVTLLDASGALWSAEGRPKAETAARLVELLGPAQSPRS
ncbi:MAG: phosphopantothenoylcysteine decarboxylase [Planctomycetota bacterium]|nr:phosphopantothenoylcysteine decarboxylase [Planctomycetota bacterium]MDG1983887.1 phosphopantothenoylcysteine decarboxylase [Planctomycetota bacterium]